MRVAMNTLNRQPLLIGIRELLGVVLPGLFMFAISIVGVRLSTDLQSHQESLRVQQHQLLNIVDSSRSAQLFYKNQQESWRNLQVDGITEYEFAHHLREYKGIENLVQRQLEIVRNNLIASGLELKLTDKLIAQHLRLSKQNAQSLLEYNPNAPEKWLSSITLSRGLEQQLGPRFGTLIGSVMLEATDKINEQNEESENSWQTTKTGLLWLTAIGVAFTSWIAWLIQSANRRLARALDTLQYAQIELVRTEKLAGLGALVAGVSHELNTPIGNSKIISQSMKEWVGDLSQAGENGSLKRSDLTRFCEQAQEGCLLLENSLNRAVEIVGNFKQVAVDQSSCRKRMYDLKTVVDEIVNTLAHQFKPTPYQLVTQVPEGIQMKSYPGALGQVLNNLILNALRHAFDGLPEGQVTVDVSVPAPTRVRISVSDNGVGIPDKLRSKIFDPFFTTKMGSGGSGLGLYIVHNLVTGPLEGKLWLDATYHRGTRFVFDIAIIISANTNDDL
ncbi:MAG: signal transduction histidine kinase [Psychromonas sp.]